MPDTESLVEAAQLCRTNLERRSKRDESYRRVFQEFAGNVFRTFSRDHVARLRHRRQAESSDHVGARPRFARLLRNVPKFVESAVLLSSILGRFLLQFFGRQQHRLSIDDHFLCSPLVDDQKGFMLGNF